MKAIFHMHNAKNRNGDIREISTQHDKIIYLKGKEWGIFEVATRKCYESEKG